MLTEVKTSNVCDDQPIIPEPYRLISASVVREMFGGVSSMTVWRWLQDESLGFPKPIYVQRRRFWRDSRF